MINNIKAIIGRGIAAAGRALIQSPVLITSAIFLAISSLVAIGIVVYLYGFAPESAALFTAWATIVGVVITQVVAARLARAAQRQQQKLETDRTEAQQELETGRAQAARFQAYLEQMEKLLLDHQLRSATKTDNLPRVAGGVDLSKLTEDSNDARVVAQAQTLAVLEGESDPTRKRILLLFLYDSALIDKRNPILNLTRANLSGANLAGVNLFRANLSRVVLAEADLTWARLNLAVLSNANLFRVNLSEAYLPASNLREAYLREADLREARLMEADLSGADLSEADLYGARLRKADLYWTILEEANLEEANLEEANLEEANLMGVDLREATGLTQEQIDQANGDVITKLPNHLKRPTHWSLKEERHPTSPLWWQRGLA